MNKNLTTRLLVLLGALLLSFSVAAQEGGNFQHAGNDLGDRASLQRGAKLFVNYCSGCHSMQFMRTSRMAEDLGLTEEEVMQNLNFTGAKFGEHMNAAMPAAEAAKWFGKAPPDLSLMSRVRGSDYIFTYLKSFYVDQSRPMGWNNTVFPNASMLNPLWDLQGVQNAEYGAPDPKTGDRPIIGLKLMQPGRQNAQQFDQTVCDITNFLEYAGDPGALKSPSTGLWTILFLAVLAFLAYLLKEEYWRDVH